MSRHDFMDYLAIITLAVWILVAGYVGFSIHANNGILYAVNGGNVHVANVGQWMECVR